MTTVVPGGLITLEYAAEGLNFRDVVSAPNATRDADLTAYIQAATPVIENVVGPVLQVPKTVEFDGGVEAIVLPHLASSVTQVIENDIVLSAGSDYQFNAAASIVYRGTATHTRCFASGTQVVQITYVTGFATVPQTLQLAARELVRFWWQQGKASTRPAYGDALEGTAPQGFALPKRVVEYCDAYLGSSIGFA